MTNEMSMNIATWIGAVSTGVAALAAMGGIWVAYQQLSRLSDSIILATKDQKLSILMAVLEMESRMNERKDKLDDAADVATEAAGVAPPDAVAISKAMQKLDRAKENYFNALDRFCYCVVRKIVPDRDWKLEYRDLVFETVSSYSTDFGTGTRFRNIVKVYEMWKEK